MENIDRPIPILSQTIQLEPTSGIRNTVVHGGSILTDIQVINAFDTVESCERVTIWKNAFRGAYGIPFREVEKSPSDIPEKILHVFNKRASAFHLNSWKNDEERRRDNLVLDTGILWLVDSGPHPILFCLLT